jgi:hypothetical protein
MVLREVRPPSSVDRQPRQQAATLLAVALLSAAMLAFELTLTRLFALAQFYHFAFMVISLALLGSGASGSLLSVWPGLKAHVGWWAAGFALATLVSYGILNWVPFDSYAIAWEGKQVAFLVLTLAGAALPFVFSGLFVGALLAEEVSELHRIYAANLAGSALGCLMVLPLLDWFGGEGALFVCAALGLAAGVIYLAPRLSTGQWTIPGAAASLLGAGLLIGVAVAGPGWASIRLSPYKGLSQALLAPTARHTFSAWNAVARVDVVESESIHIFPGLSQNALMMEPPTQAGLTLDGDNLMPITALAPEDELAATLAENVPEAVVASLRPGAATRLILEPGGGWDALMALAGGAESVTVVERNPLVLHVLQDEYHRFTSGLYDDPRVTVVQSEGRVYVERTAERYGVIIVSLSDTFHPVTSGAYSLGEDYLYTVEAMAGYFDRLAPDGLLVVTRWLQTPPTESLRMLGTLIEALEASGIEEPEAHLAAFRSLRTITFVVGRQPFDEGELARLRAFAEARGYDLVWLPGIRPGEVNLRNRLPEPAYYNAFVALLADPDSFVRDYEYDIRPATDDRPFFAHYFRLRQTPDVFASLGRTWQPFGGSGYFVLAALLIVAGALAALFILGPLAVGRLPSAASHAQGVAPPAVRAWGLLYFLTLGLGFLFVEIPLAQRFVLYWGEPVIALAVVLFAILLFSGLGSLTAPRWPLRGALGALVVMILIMPPLLGWAFRVTLGWPAAGKLLVTLLMLAPPGLLMGVPFARGTQLVERMLPGLVPWAWAINGSASVISGVLAMMLALSWGYAVVLWVGAGAYAAALGAGWALEARAMSMAS